MLFSLIIYTFSVNGVTTNFINLPDFETCMQTKHALTSTYDKMNETTLLGYSLTCEQTDTK